MHTVTFTIMYQTAFVFFRKRRDITADSGTILRLTQYLKDARINKRREV